MSKMQRTSRLALGAIGLALVALGLFFYVNAKVPLLDYITWRWMVTFKQPIEPVADYRVVVTKTAHRLNIYRGDALVGTWPVALSHRGLGPRRIWADELTPEGKFRIASMQYESAFGPRQMLLETTAQSLADYRVQYGAAGQARLSEWEARHGPLDTIWEVYDFNKAYADYRIWNDILIHGGGAGRDWTWGCIALDNDDVVELFDLLHQSSRRGLGVEVEIRP